MSLGIPVPDSILPKIKIELQPVTWGSNDGTKRKDFAEKLLKSIKE
jgi:hypothetical protein